MRECWWSSMSKHTDPALKLENRVMKLVKLSCARIPRPEFEHVSRLGIFKENIEYKGSNIGYEGEAMEVVAELGSGQDGVFLPPKVSIMFLM